MIAREAAVSCPLLGFGRASTMRKEQVLRLVPSGKKLDDIRRDVDLLAGLSASLLLVVLAEHAEAADAILGSLQSIQRLPHLTRRQRAACLEASEIIKRVVSELPA
jgi:hypothetical protein